MSAYLALHRQGREFVAQGGDVRGRAISRLCNVGYGEVEGSIGLGFRESNVLGVGESNVHVVGESNVFGVGESNVLGVGESDAPDLWGSNVPGCVGTGREG